MTQYPWLLNRASRAVTRAEDILARLGELARDRLGDGLGGVAAIAVGPDKGGGERQQFGLGTGAVGQGEVPLDGSEGQVGAGAGIASRRSEFCTSQSYLWDSAPQETGRRSPYRPGPAYFPRSVLAASRQRRAPWPTPP